jgi:hypothetical protein
MYMYMYDVHVYMSRTCICTCRMCVAVYVYVHVHVHARTQCVCARVRAHLHRNNIYTDIYTYVYCLEATVSANLLLKALTRLWKTGGNVTRLGASTACLPPTIGARHSSSSPARSLSLHPRKKPATPAASRPPPPRERARCPTHERTFCHNAPSHKPSCPHTAIPCDGSS